MGSSSCWRALCCAIFLLLNYAQRGQAQRTMGACLGCAIVSSLLHPSMELTHNFSLQELQILFGTGHADGSSPSPVQIGASLTLDIDRRTKYGRIGYQIATGYRLFFRWLSSDRGGIRIRGVTRPVALYLLDDQSQQTQAEHNVRYLLDERQINFLLGPYGSDLTSVAASIASNGDAVIVAPACSNPDIVSAHPQLFSLLPPDTSYLLPAVETLKTLGARTFAVLYENTSFATRACLSVGGSPKQAFQNLGVEVVASAVVGEGASDNEVDTALRNLSASSPDILIGCVLDDVCHKVIRKARDLNFNPDAIVLTVCVSLPGYHDAVGDVGQSIIGVAPWAPQMALTSELTGLTAAEFVHSYMAAYNGSVPSYHAAAAFAAAATLVYAIETANSIETDHSLRPGAVADALRNMDKTSIYGRIQFSNNGQIEDKVRMVQRLQGTRPNWIEWAGMDSSMDAGVSSIRYPKPPWDAIDCIDEGRSLTTRGITLDISYEAIPRGVCAHRGLSDVSDAQLCRDAAMRLGFDDTAPGRSESAMPAGCYLEPRTGTVFFNDNPMGIGSGADPNGAVQLVCQRNFSAGAYPVCRKCANYEVAEFDSTIGFRVCKKCQAGYLSTVTEDDKVFCLPCASGRFMPPADNEPSRPHLRQDDDEEFNHQMCTSCPQGTFQSEANSTMCMVCPPGKYTPSEGNTECLNCTSGYAASHGSSACTGCPIGALCAADADGLFTSFTNQDGYYLADFDNGKQELYRCPHGEGEACLAHGQCYKDLDSGEPAMDGFACGRCKEGYGRPGVLDVCTKCPSVIGAVLGVTLNGLLYVLIVGLVCALTLSANHLAIQKLQSVVVKQLFNYLQIAVIVASVSLLSMPFEIPGVDIIYVLSFLSRLGSTEYGRRSLDCLQQWVFPGHEYKVTIVVGLAWLPVWVLCIVCVWGIYIRCWRLRHLGWHEMIPHLYQHLYHYCSSLVTVLVVNMFLLLPQVTHVLLQVFRCKYLDVIRLAEDPSVICYEGDHFKWLMVSSAGFAVYSLGIPAILWWVLRQYKIRDRLLDPEVAQMLGFLYNGFDPNCYYFECVLLIRRALYQLIVIIPGLTSSDEKADKMMQTVSLLAMSSFFMGIHLSYEPYDNRTYFILDKIEGASLLAVFGTTLLFTYLALTDDAILFQESVFAKLARDRTVSILVLLLHLRCVALATWAIIRGTVKQYVNLCLRKGTVRMHERGLMLQNLSPDAKLLLQTLLMDLASLHIDARALVSYEGLIAALQRIGVHAYYLRMKEAKAKSQDPITSFLDTASSRIDRLPLSDNSKRVIHEHILERMGKYMREARDWLRNAASPVVRGTSAASLASSTQSENIETDGGNVDSLSRFTYENVQNINGKEFDVDELYHALLALGHSLCDQAMPPRPKVPEEHEHADCAMVTGALPQDRVLRSELRAKDAERQRLEELIADKVDQISRPVRQSSIVRLTRAARGERIREAFTEYASSTSSGLSLPASSSSNGKFTDPKSVPKPTLGLACIGDGDDIYVDRRITPRSARTQKTPSSARSCRFEPVPEEVGECSAEASAPHLQQHPTDRNVMQPAPTVLGAPLPTFFDSQQSEEQGKGNTNAWITSARVSSGPKTAECARFDGAQAEDTDGWSDEADLEDGRDLEELEEELKRVAEQMEVEAREHQEVEQAIAELIAEGAELEAAIDMKAAQRKAVDTEDSPSPRIERQMSSPLGHLASRLRDVSEERWPPLHMDVGAYAHGVAEKVADESPAMAPCAFTVASAKSGVRPFSEPDARVSERSVERMPAIEQLKPAYGDVKLQDDALERFHDTGVFVGAAAKPASARLRAAAKPVSARFL